MTFLRLLSVKSSVSLSSARAQFCLEGNYGLVTKLAFQNTAVTLQGRDIVFF